MKLPLPFTITIHGIAYPTDTESRGVFSKKGELRKHLEQALLSDLRPDVEVELDIAIHEYLDRKDWKEDDD